MHINADHLLVEVVDKNDQPVVDQVGEIVVTDLDSYEMPLIRYHIGDRGVMSSERCPCGRPFPMLRSVDGRTADRLITRDGREIHDKFFVHSLMRIPGIARFQAVQKSLDRLDVNIELDGSTSPDAVASDTRAKLQELDAHQIQIAVNFVDRIPLTSAGKMRHFVCEVPA
jgi:phenylacetate-CoA ligase